MAGRWAVVWLVAAVAVVVLWTLTRLQDICLNYWSQVGGDAPPCWLPFGS
jgi:hypothetical protein